MRAELECLATWRQAAQLLRQALHQDPARIDAIFQLGITELYTGNPGRAVNYLRIAYQRAPWSPQINFHLGECLRLLGSSRAAWHLTQAREWTYRDSIKHLASAALEQIEKERLAAEN